jgi:hypothetical protein
MALTIDVKRYCCEELKGNKFIAIAPVWSGYAKYMQQKPINHIKIEGVQVPWIDLDRFVHCSWHPDNLFSEEKWIEVHLFHCSWKLNQYGEYKQEARSRIGWYGEQDATSWSFFVPAKQLQRLFSEEIVYKSKDREEAEGREYEQAWAEMHSNAIANSYY